MSRPLRKAIPLLLLATLPLASVSASASPRRLVLQGSRAGSDSGESRGDLFQLNLNNGRRRQLTDDGGSHSPVVSPSGTRVLFSCGGFVPRRTEICVMNSDGSGRKRLTSNKVFDGEASWSPSGGRIVFARYVASVRSNELFVMSARGTNVRRVTNNAVGEGYPVWRPGTNRIAYVRLDYSKRPRQTDIFTIRSTGSRPRRITTTRLGESALAWDPSGRRLAFIRSQHVFIKHVERSGIRRVTARRNAAWAPVWGPEGGSLIFERISRGASPSGIVEVDTLSRQTRLLLKAPLHNGKCPGEVCYYTEPSW